jgi:hypothetical protein
MGLLGLILGLIVAAGFAVVTISSLASMTAYLVSRARLKNQKIRALTILGVSLLIGGPILAGIVYEVGVFVYHGVLSW